MANFVVDPTVAVSTHRLVFLYEFRWDVGDLDADIFRVGHWSVKVEIFEVNGAEVRSFAREHTIEHQLEEFKGCSVGANVPRETDAIASDGDVRMIRIVFIRTHLTNNHGVAYFFSFVGRDVMIIKMIKKVLVLSTRLESGVVPEPSQFLDTNVQAHWRMKYPM